MAFVFTLMFGVLYIQIFSSFNHKTVNAPQSVVYYLQVGVFAKEENANRRLQELQGLQLDSYIFEKKEQFYVVTGLSLNGNDRKQYKSVLDQAGLGSYDKEIIVKDQTVIQKWQKQEVKPILELFSKEE